MDQPDTFDFDPNEFEKWWNEEGRLSFDTEGPPVDTGSRFIDHIFGVTDIDTVQSRHTLVASPMNPTTQPIAIYNRDTRKGFSAAFPGSYQPKTPPPIPPNPESTFKFESGGVVIEDRSRATKPTKPVDPDRLRCQYPGCKSRRTFGRKYDLQRHMKKHTEGQSFSCPVQGCDEKFYRADKTGEHIRHNHHDGESALCPVSTCRKLLPVLLLKIHCRTHRGYTIENQAASILSARSAAERHCPVTTCNASIDASKMQQHLANHTPNHRYENQHRIQEAGYVAETVEISCPVCREKFRKHEDIIDHFIVHLVTNIEHFLALWATFQAPVKRMDALPWQTLLISENEKFWPTFYENPRCPLCKEVPGNIEIYTRSKFVCVDHHLSLLVPPETLRPYREAILRIWPDFACHPVFNDIHTTSN